MMNEQETLLKTKQNVASVLKPSQTGLVMFECSNWRKSWYLAASHCFARPDVIDRRPAGTQKPEIKKR